MKKIVYVTNRLRPGAIPNILLNTLPIINKEYEIYILSLQTINDNNLKSQLESFSYNVSSLELNRVSFFTAIYKVKQSFNEINPNIIHSHLGRADFFSAICKPKNTILISTFHSMRDNYNFFTRFLYKFTDKKVNVRTAVSKAVKESWYNDSLLKSRCEVIYNPVRIINGNQNNKSKIRKELGIPENTYVITNIGNIRKQKNQIELIKAFSLFKKESSNSILLIIGRKGDSYEEIIKEIKKKSLENSVKLLGFRNDVIDLLSISDVFVFPSQTEGLGIAVIEAMGNKVPVIASQIDAITEYIDNNRNGLLFEVGDYTTLSRLISEVIHNTKLSDKLKYEGYETVKEKFEFTKIAKEYLDLYNEF